MQKREVEIAVISDVHLGTYGCHASDLNEYLASIKPKILILNGDIIDMWQFSKSYFPESHIKVIRSVLKLIEEGTLVYYLTGNHDENLRKFTNLYFGKLIVTDKLVMNIDGKKAWFFHGDIFDFSVKHAKWIAKLGGKGYDMLIILNKMINYFSMRLGKGRISFSKKVKDSVKRAISFIDDFESTVVELAMNQKYDYVICGHIHSPVIKTFSTNEQNVTYLNSGDWIENLTALEYQEKEWSIYKHLDSKNARNPLVKMNSGSSGMNAVKQREAQVLNEYVINHH